MGGGWGTPQGAQSALLRDGALFVCIESGCSSVSPSPAPGLDALPCSAGRLHSPQGFSSGPKFIPPFIWGEGRRQRVISYKLFSRNQALKTTVSEENEEEQTTHIFGTQTPRQTDGRQTLTHTQALGLRSATPHLVSLLVSHPWDGWGMATGRQSHPRSISPAVKSTTTRGKEGVSEKRRGTLHILVSLADSCSSLVQASHGGTHTSAC